MHSCRPAKMSRCCSGGTPDFSSTFCLTRRICLAFEPQDGEHEEGAFAHRVRWVDIQRNLSWPSGEIAHSGGSSAHHFTSQHLFRKRLR